MAARGPAPTIDPVTKALGAVAEHLGFDLDLDGALGDAGTNHFASPRKAGGRGGDSALDQRDLGSILDSPRGIEPLAHGGGEPRRP